MKVYKYGLHPPKEAADVVRQQIRLAHVYRNKLTEIERKRRASVREALAAYRSIGSLEVAVRAADEKVVEATRKLKQDRVDKRSRRKDAEELKVEVKNAREEKKLLREELREERKKLREDQVVTARMDEINDASAAEVRAARSECGVYWGTYLLVEAAMQAARMAPLYDWKTETDPNDPGFVRWSGTGRIGVQIQGGMSLVELHSCEDTRLRIAPIETSWKSGGIARDPGQGKRQKMRTKLWMRVGSDGRAPVWACWWDMIMHRPLPERCVIKAASVTCRKCGPRERWSLEITVDDSACFKPKAGTGCVAIDIGWRVTETGMRVAAWIDDEGNKGELQLPEDIVGSVRKCNELRKRRDDEMNSAIRKLCEWYETRDMPEWLRARTVKRDTQAPTKKQALAHLIKWRSQARLTSLCRAWPKDEQDEAYEALEAWRYHDHHLWRWETSAREKAIRRRREGYRCVAATLAETYKTVVFECFKLSNVARKTGNETEQEKAANSNRHLASVSEFRSSVMNAFRSRSGADIVEVPANLTTQWCASCNQEERFDAAPQIDHVCSHCGSKWDQDYNAARNLLRRWRERSSDGEDAGPARNSKKRNGIEGEGESKWSRAKRMRAQKDARKTASREPTCECPE